MTRDAMQVAEKQKELEINRRRRQAERDGLRYEPFAKDKEEI